MPSRRDFLLAAMGLMLGGRAIASAGTGGLGWQAFLRRMGDLADRHALGDLAAADAGAAGTSLMAMLDPSDPDFQLAVTESWESGNAFWLWQRLTKEAGMNGGILTVERGHDVPLHDHPGATGMLRVLSGELEVWQFDRAPAAGEGQATLQRLSHRVLRAGDTALLLPHSGNIHALRSVSSECRMLDYFIPPYRRAERAWFEPLLSDWAGREQLVCRVVPEHAFAMG